MALCTGNSIAEPNFVSGELLIKFKNENNTNYHSKKYFEGTKIHVISVPEQTEEKVRDALSKNPNVEFVELNELHEPVTVPNDPKVGNQWWLNTINAFDAMDVSFGQGVVVGVCDSGFNNHEDLQNVMLTGWDFANNDPDITTSSGHGTGVSGVIAANTNNALGVAAPAYGVQILPGKIGDDANNHYATYSAMVACQEYMANNGAKVINLSYGGACGTSNATAARYADSKGVVVVWAAGNDNSELTCTNVEEQILAAATTSSNARASFSNYGAAVDLAAPGSGVYSLYGRSYTDYGNLSGTSFSSPIVAAVAAVVYSKNPGISAQEVRNTLYSTATDLGNTSYYGHGLVNALGAVNATVTPPPPPPEPYCGDGTIDAGEECDDGNTANGDGCSSICIVEPPVEPNPPDLIAPIINLSKPKDGDKVSRLSISGKITDNEMLDYAEVYLNDGLVKYMNLTDQTDARIHYNWKGTIGAHSITIIALDLAGNETVKSVTFEIVGRK